MANEKYVGKYQKSGMRKPRHIKQRTALLCVLLIFSLAAGGTLAYIVARTDHVDNQFQPASVTCRVNAGSGSSFDVTNTGNVNALIRAAIVVNWMDENGNVRGIAPSPSDYTLQINTADWQQDADTGFYYYQHPVLPGEPTSDLILSYGLASGVTAPGGYTLSVEVVAEAIQADGDTDVGNVPAYQDAWGIASISGS